LYNKLTSVVFGSITKKKKKSGTVWRKVDKKIQSIVVFEKLEEVVLFLFVEFVFCFSFVGLPEGGRRDERPPQVTGNCNFSVLRNVGI
jgi:hypothetical protein